MTARDRWTDDLECPKCGKSGVARSSQADGYAFIRGDDETRVDDVPEGFTYTQNGNVVTFYCETCKVPSK